MLNNFDEVNAVDKYEYKLKTEQMLELMESGSYSRAAEVADEIDWRRVRNAAMLSNVSEIYEKSGEYQKSYEILTLAYHRAEGSRKIISRLCTLALKTGNVDEAIDFYDEFVQLAPKDPNQYILRYKILRAQRAPVEQQIEALETFKKSEYIEEWAYELAKLYQEAGMTVECLEECDDLILWFSEGQYVYKAMELKMQYKPLTPSQQEKYDRRYEKPLDETEEIPNILSYVAAKNDEVEGISYETESFEPVEVSLEDEKPVLEDEEVMAVNCEEEKVAEASEETVTVSSQEESEEETSEEHVPEETVSEVKDSEEVTVDEPPKKKKIGDTMPLDVALRKLLHPELEELIPPEETVDSDTASMDFDLTETGTMDLDLTETGAMDFDLTETGAMDLDLTETGAMDFDLTETGAIDFVEEAETGFDIEEEEDNVSEEITEETSPINFRTVGHAEPEPEEELADLEQAMGEIESVADMEIVNKIAKGKLREAAAKGEMMEIIPDEEPEDDPEEDLLPELDLEDENVEESMISEGDTMETKKQTAPILPPDIQRMIDEIEGVIPPSDEVEEKPVVRLKRKEEPLENMGKLAENLRLDDDFADDYDEDYDEVEEFDEPEDFKEVEEFDEPEDFEEVEEFDEPEDFEEVEEFGEAEDFDEVEEFDEPEDFEEVEEFGEAEDFDEVEEFDEFKELLEEEEEPREKETFEESYDYLNDYFDEDDDEDEYDRDSLFEDAGEALDFEEEFSVNPQFAEEEDDREIPDDDEPIDIMSATTPLSRKETAKLIATGKTAPLPLNEISDALSMDTGFVVHGRYDLEMQSGIGTRAGLTEEQKKLFSYFVPVRGMSEQLVDVLEQDKNCTNRKGTSRTGNLLIIGNKGNGKTVLAVDVVKAIQKQREIKQGKVAIVTGESLNKKKISDIVEKLYGGALIIEKASKMNEKTVARLNKAMEQDTGELLIVLEEQRKPLDRLLSSNREFRKKFTSRLEVPIFINDELVTFGQTYANENGYRIDEMGILALYSKIDSLQREDHSVTVAEVKEVMDEAIAHSQKASAKKLMKRVFGKNTDEADRIILSEKDFNV